MQDIQTGISSHFVHDCLFWGNFRLTGYVQIYVDTVNKGMYFSNGIFELGHYTHASFFPRVFSERSHKTKAVENVQNNVT